MSSSPSNLLLNPTASRPGWPSRLARLSLGQWLGARIGLEGKILIAVMAVLTAALSAASWVWGSQSQAMLSQVMGEEAQQIARTLSLATGPVMMDGQSASLTRMGDDLLRSSNILFVAFYDARGHLLAHTNRDAKFDFRSPSLLPAEIESMGRVERRTVPSFGDYLRIGAPVVMKVPTLDSANRASTLSWLEGYVVIGISPRQEELQISRMATMAIGIGCVMVLISLPLTILLVHRIFKPIRQLVDATNRITAGELDAQVAVDRRDRIGDLARSFNEMVKTVKRQREDLENANDDLEEKVEQRTAQLATANKRLSDEIAEKEDFLRAVSHDLNAPLRNISGMAAMLLMKHREKFDEDIVHRLERIQKNVEVETDLISELLELSRIKTRRQKMEMVEITPLVRELEEMFENDLKTRQISLILDTPLPVVHGERPRLRQIFQNLIDNAVKYMGEGSVREIHLGCIVKTHEAEFYVRDTGLGIDPEDLTKIFFVFRRGKGSTTHNIAGKGVGLASVKSIIETYSGTIWAESRSGEGSTFRFTINGQFVPSAQQKIKNTMEKTRI